MNKDNFLCDRCLKAICHDCLEIADEYAELLRNARKQLSICATRLSNLDRQLHDANRRAAAWEKTAKLGYPDVIQKWMDSNLGGLTEEENGGDRTV